MKEAKISGKVTDVLDEYEIVINVGRNQGVKKEMKFSVFGEKPIIDPDTHNSLGKYKYNKVKVAAIDVQENYSVATSKIETITSQVASWAFFEPELYPKVKSGTKAGIESLIRDVKRGDLVEQT